jgi:hypothetical protein
MSRTFYLDKAQTQQFTLPCEDYDTGTYTQVALAEEREDPEFSEFHSAEASGAIRTFYCPFDKRFLVIENLLGFAKVVDGAPIGGFNGKHIHRVNPYGYDMGKGTGASNWWVYATKVQVAPDGEKLNSFDAGVGAIAYYPFTDYAKLIVHFAAQDFSYFSDGDVFDSGSGGSGVAVYREWFRNARIIQKPAGQFFQYPAESLKEVDYPAAGQSKPMNFKPSVIDNVADFWVQILDLPYDPIKQIYICFGKTNSYAVFNTPDNPAGQPAESLHFVAADITPKPRRCSRKYWDINLGFKKVYNRDELGFAVGVNYIRDVVDVAGVRRLRFFRVSQDGTNTLTGENPMIQLEDFRKIFWIP